MPSGFLAPWFLGGLALVAIPVLVHLTRRDRAAPVPFPSLMFVRRLPQATTRRRRGASRSHPRSGRSSKRPKPPSSRCGTSLTIDRGDIFILRRDAEGRAKKMPFDYRDALSGDEPLELEPGNTIVVP